MLEKELTYDFGQSAQISFSIYPNSSDICKLIVYFKAKIGRFSQFTAERSANKFVIF